MSDDSSEDVPATPSTYQLQRKAQEVLSEVERAQAEAVFKFQLEQGLLTLESLRLAHNALAKDALRRSLFRPWKWLLVAALTALGAPIATDAWTWLKGFHH